LPVSSPKRPSRYSQGRNKLPRSKLTRYSGTSPEEFVSLSHSSVQQAGRYSASQNKKFQVPLEKEIKIVTQLRKELSGLAFPLFVIEAPGKIGKIPVPLDFWDFRKESFFDFQGEKAFLPFFS